MADRYWRGGTGTWDPTTTTNWSATSGGAAGASVPTAADSVFFDQAGTYTVSMTSNIACLNFNVSAGSITFANGSNPALTISGSMLVSNVTPIWTSDRQITFNATTAGKTITSNGIIFAGSFTFTGIGGVWTLGSSLTATSANAFNISNGTFDTSSVGNYALTVPVLYLQNTATAILNLNASTVTLTLTSGTFDASGILNAGTSTINLTATSTGITFGGGSKTFYNVNFIGAQDATNRTHAITGSNTFNNLSFTGPSVVGITNVMFAANQIINGVLSTNGTVANRRVFFQSSTFGMQWHLFCNSAASLTDADFRDLNIKGTASPISGTRIGDLRGCSGITFDAPKTVYRQGDGNWSLNKWAAIDAGVVSLDNFPLAQDTAIINNNSGLSGGIITLDSASVSGFPTIDASNRTFRTTTFDVSTNTPTIYGNWKNGSGITISGTGIITFAGRNTQTITSAGKTFTTPITINSPGGTVELADALNIGSNTLTVTNGTFDTKNFNVTAGQLLSSNSNVRTINLGSSTITFSGVTAFQASNITNLTFNAGTSQINFSTNFPSLLGPTQPVNSNLTFNNVSYTNAGGSSSEFTIDGLNTFNNLTILPPSSGIINFTITNNQTVNGTLTIAGASSTRRVFVRSNTLGTARTLTVNSLSATDCDFRDITIAGAAAGSSPTRAGNCGGNSGITFPAAKTVYWNLAGTQNWSATGWAPSSGGTPNINNFPLAQDTAVFDNAGAITAVTIDAGWNIGTFDASLRTSAMTMAIGACQVYKDWKHGTGVTSLSNSGTMSFLGRGTQTITSNGVAFNNPVNIDCITGTYQLADAIILGSTRTLTLTSGTFDAVTYNVTTSVFTGTGSTTRTLRMGTGIWTLTGGSTTLWNIATPSSLTCLVSTSTIVFSATTNGITRTFNGGGLYYNKLTIGGGTATTQTTNFSGGGDTFGELASTKTVAHTINIGISSPAIGLWSVTGTAGNVVTVSGTGAIAIVGARVTGVNYLAMGTIGFSATSPGEFYAGANSTGSNATIIKTAAPSPVTRYWRGGTGTWDATTTTNWSDTSGGAGGFSVPTSADAVIFDSASNATAYTVTLTATQLRCGSLTMAGPASGNVTWAGSAPLAIHNNVTLAAAGITRTYTGTITLSGSTTGKTFTTNGVVLSSAIIINSVGCSWSLGSAMNNGTVVSQSLTITNGSFNTANYSLTSGSIVSDGVNSRSITFGSSTISITLASGTQLNFGTSENSRAALTFTAGTSQISISGNTAAFSGNGQTFYNVDFTGLTAPNITVNGTNTFNNLTFVGHFNVGVKNISITANQTINGTLTFNAATNATMRTAVLSNPLGTTRTLTCAAFSATDIDFRDITIAGAAAPVSGTRLGNLGGNSGITTSTPKTVYWNLVAGGDWSATAWATGSLGTPNANNFPLAQDTAIIENAGLNISASISLNTNWHIGTINMSTRTNVMILAFAAPPFIYGDWTFGTGVTTTGTGIITFAKRGTQTITSNGGTFSQSININSFNGTVQLADALTTSSTITLPSGTFNAVSYNVTCTVFASTGSATRTLSMGSGLWTLTGGSTTIWNITGTGLTLNQGSANIICTGTGSSTFVGGSLSYNKLTIGGTSTLSFVINGNNTFSEIASTRTVAYQITLTTTTQTVGAFTVSGSAGNRVTISGTSVTSFATLIFTGATYANLDYIIPTFLKVYDINSDWYAGNNSTNGGSYGWIFAAAAVIVNISSNFFALF